eukprot:4835673-Amphidinium_carterae.4
MPEPTQRALAAKGAAPRRAASVCWHVHACCPKTACARNPLDWEEAPAGRRPPGHEEAGLPLSSERQSSRVPPSRGPVAFGARKHRKPTL